jgi:autoinducer 2-degrading protein
MVVTTVMIKVLEQHIDDFIEATIVNHEESVKEPGNRRFDLLQRVDDPSSFILYEAYDSEESAAAHKNTAHYKTWRDSVAAHMAQPRQGIKYRAVRPL